MGAHDSGAFGIESMVIADEPFYGGEQSPIAIGDRGLQQKLDISWRESVWWTEVSSRQYLPDEIGENVEFGEQQHCDEDSHVNGARRRISNQGIKVYDENADCEGPAPFGGQHPQRVAVLQPMQHREIDEEMDGDPKFINVTQRDIKAL